MGSGLWIGCLNPYLCGSLRAPYRSAGAILIIRNKGYPSNM